jgi:hypothetical protein
LIKAMLKEKCLQFLLQYNK